jgi:AcrR family transcriptional regulator
MWADQSKGFSMKHGQELLEKPRSAGRPRSETARKQILQAAYELLRAKGIQAASTQEIAAAAGVSTATLYRWWDTKEAIMLDALFEYVKPKLTLEGTGSPLARLRKHAIRGVTFLNGKDGKVMTRLITGIHDNEELRRQFLEHYYFPRRAMARRLIQQAVEAGELPKGTDPEVVIDALYGPQIYRLIMGHAPLTKAFAESIADVVLR